MSILDKIVEKKRERLDFLKTKIPLEEIRSRASDAEKPRNFRNAVKRESGSVRLIAEIKKASPSRNVIRQDFDPVAIASIYEKKAVDAISVLTEEDNFQGKIKHLLEIKEVTNRPLLRKDFILDEYQLYESKAYGADAILLIASILSRNQAADYFHLARDLGLSTLFEVHDFRELEMAFRIDSDIIGINNRDLMTLRVDLETTLKLKREIFSDKIIVSESGIKTRDDVLKLDKAGIDAILVGTVFMEADDIERKIDALMGMSEA